MKTLLLITYTALWLTLSTHGQNPVIQVCTEQVRVDSITATLEHLQAYGTRYALADNRKAVASWIMGKFSSYGYPDVKLDSFQVAYGDSTYWQYNVICTLHGASAPGEVCILGGHYDSYCITKPDSLAPGVDDNGSAVAATLEAARVMKLMNYQPESTIRFILFAGEEMGFWGSNHQAAKSTETGEKIMLMMNMDMIAYNPDSLKVVYLFRYKGAESAYRLATGVFQRYTSLSVVTGPVDFEHRSDSFIYWQKGFQSTWAFEYEFNAYYHSVDDVVSNCNIGYCAEIAQGSLATIMEMQFLPFPQGIAARSSADNIVINWNPTGNAHLKGYNIYRSENDSAGFVKLNTALITDTSYADPSVETKKDYYYFATMISKSLEESVASGTVHGVRFGFTDTLLVVACMKGAQTTPDSIVQFYASVLDSIPFRWFDMNKDHPLTLATLSQYRNALWVINSLEYDQIPGQVAGDLETFFANHGNMMFAGFSFSRFILGSIGFPMKFPENSLIRKYFRADSVSKKISSYMYRAYPDEAGYDTLWVDPAKSMKPGYPGELNNIEVFTPASGGDPVYRFDSKYGPGTVQGAQQGKIVGLEYMGDDYKTILLSFPLYYMDTADANRLMSFVINNKFGIPAGLASITDFGLHIANYPNPASQSTTFAYTLRKQVHTTIHVFNSFGQLVAEPLNANQINGEQKLTWNMEKLPAGVYFYRIRAGNEVGSGKVIKW
ncbi:MAG: M20/M25/M40 family metallo-hydrolase [Bacteroidales bacterium]|nr:M20/M25/M40 family metallo-hydrolase [Bacteroidales bacterium]